MGNAGSRTTGGIGKTYWNLSLFLETGKHTVSTSSGYRFHKWHRISDGADAKRRELSAADWQKTVTFEHCRPLKTVHNMIKDDQADPQRVLEIVGEYPPVIVLSAENPGSELNDLDPVERYKAAGIGCSAFNLKSDKWKDQAKLLFRT